MTLLITLAAAVLCSVIFYRYRKNDIHSISTLCYLYWGASLMWMVDEMVVYSDNPLGYSLIPAESMLDDALLGCAVVAFGILIWLIQLIVKKAMHRKDKGDAYVSGI